VPGTNTGQRVWNAHPPDHGARGGPTEGRYDGGSARRRTTRGAFEPRQLAALGLRGVMC